MLLYRALLCKARISVNRSEWGINEVVYEGKARTTLSRLAALGATGCLRCSLSYQTRPTLIIAKCSKMVSGLG